MMESSETNLLYEQAMVGARSQYDASFDRNMHWREDDRLRTVFIAVMKERGWRCVELHSVEACAREAR